MVATEDEAAMRSQFATDSPWRSEVGMGQSTYSYKGHEMVTHGGSGVGFVSHDRPMQVPFFEED